MPWTYVDKNPLSERTLKTERLNVHYYESGRPEGYPIIFLHEELTSARWWAGVQQMFPFRYRTFAPDLRGYGLSSGNSELKPSVQDYSEDIYAFAQALQLPEFFLVGWGVSGIIAMQYMAAHPDTLLGVALVNTALPGDKHLPFDTDKMRQLARALYDKNGQSALSLLQQNFFFDGNFPIGSKRSDTTIAGVGETSDPQVLNYLLEGSLGQTAYAGDEKDEFFQSLHAFKATDILKNFPKPILVLDCREDALIDHKQSRQLFQATDPDNTANPRQEIEMVLTGHSPMVERVEGFMNEISGWADRYTTPNQFVINPSATS